MKKLVFVATFSFCSLIGKAQKQDTIYNGCAPSKNKSRNEVYIGGNASKSIVDGCPQFPGGYRAFDKFLAKNLKWPKNNPDGQGRVFISFVVEKDGKLSNIKVVRGLSVFNSEALRVIQLSPKWIPAKLNGRPVRVRFVVPINFVLAN